MTKKRILGPAEQDDLRRLLQVATLAALTNSRRWEPGELAFQGGTSLHLAHGSPRFSEDLDFMVRGGLSLEGLAKEVQRLIQLPQSVSPDLSITVSPSRDGKNPHSFVVSLCGPDVIGSAKVKIELWQTDRDVLKRLQVVVSTINSPSGFPSYVPTITLDEIFADKVYALGARTRLKERDVFDLWWLTERSGRSPQLDSNSLVERLSIYPNGSAIQTARNWLANALDRHSRLGTPAAVDSVLADLSRWLPSSWPLTRDAASSMVSTSAAHLGRGIEIMMEFEAQGCVPRER